MQVILARSAGFCYGVRRAVELARETAAERGNCWKLGDLIHNAHVIAELSALGVRKTSEPERLRAGDDISYLLIMLDEADAFVRECGQNNYRPLVSLKDVQQTLPGRFKFVLAGLHNVVRFHRDVALGRNAVITHLPSLKVTPFRTPEAQELLTEPLSYLGLSLPSKVTVSQILATVNYFPGLGPGWYRTAVRTPEENARLLSLLK